MEQIREVLQKMEDGLGAKMICKLQRIFPNFLSGVEVSEEVKKIVTSSIQNTLWGALPAIRESIQVAFLLGLQIGLEKGNNLDLERVREELHKEIFPEQMV